MNIYDYISLKIDVIFNFIRIFSVFFFFKVGSYLIVEYFLFSSFLTLISAFIILLIIRKSEKYDFKFLFYSLRFTKKYYIKTKKLAYSSLFLTIGWFLYYEMDLIIIGKLFSPSKVAIYAVAFTFLNFLRSLWNTVFSPYAQRFNHYEGNESLNEMRNLINKIVYYIH